MFTLQQMKNFIITVDCGSLNKAAKQLYMSQPALSKQIQLLEKEIGADLLVRATSGVKLTEAGSIFYEKGKKILNDINSTLHEIKKLTFSEEVLRIGALPSLGNFYVPIIIKEIQKKFNIKVELLIRDTTTELIELLDLEELDLAFTQDTSNHSSNLRFLHLFKEPYDAIVPSHHMLAQHNSIDIPSMLHENLVIHKTPCDVRHFFNNYCSAHNYLAIISLELEFNESIISYVANGFGISFLPRMVASNIVDTSIVTKNIDNKDFHRSVDLVYHPKIQNIVSEIF